MPIIQYKPTSPGRRQMSVIHVDGMAKGLGRGSPWEEFAAAALLLCGKPLRALA